MQKSFTLAFVVAVFSVATCLGQEQTPFRRKLVSQVAPTYPELARKMQIAGTVKIKVVIAATGKLKSAQVMGGSPLLVKAATDALAKWRWIPDREETTELIELNFQP
jgi:TonB family protein